MSPHDWIVVRGTGTHADGTWYDKQQGLITRTLWLPIVGVGFVDVHPTDRLETREDGAVAQVWEPQSERGER
jgi:hypothetical protein